MVQTRLAAISRILNLAINAFSTSPLTLFKPLHSFYLQKMPRLLGGISAIIFDEMGKNLRLSPAKLRRRHAEELGEAAGEIAMAVEPAANGHLLDALLRLFDEQFGGVLQAQLQHIVGHLAILAALREDGAYAFLRQRAQYKGVT